MEELEYGPNGGLVYAMEYLVDNMDWLVDEVGDFEDDYLIIDCPGCQASHINNPMCICICVLNFLSIRADRVIYTLFNLN
jgi:hypothetical protein